MDEAILLKLHDRLDEWIYDLEFLGPFNYI